VITMLAWKGCGIVRCVVVALYVVCYFELRMRGFLLWTLATQPGRDVSEIGT